MAGSAWSYTLPSVTETTEGSIVIAVDVGAAIFILYDDLTTTLFIEEGATEGFSEENYAIDVTLTNETEDQSNSIVLNVLITEPEPEEEPADF